MLDIKIYFKHYLTCIKPYEIRTVEHYMSFATCLFYYSWYRKFLIFEISSQVIS